MPRFTLKEMLVQAQAAVSGTPVDRSGYGRRRAVMQCVHANGARYTVGEVRGDSVFSTYGPFSLLHETGPQPQRPRDHERLRLPRRRPPRR